MQGPPRTSASLAGGAWSPRRQEKVSYLCRGNGEWAPGWARLPVHQSEGEEEVERGLKAAGQGRASCGCLGDSFWTPLWDQRTRGGPGPSPSSSPSGGPRGLQRRALCQRTADDRGRSVRDDGESGGSVRAGIPPGAPLVARPWERRRGRAATLSPPRDGQCGRWQLPQRAWRVSCAWASVSC